MYFNMRSGGIKNNLVEYIMTSKSKDYLLEKWYCIWLYAKKYPPSVKRKLLKLVADSFLMA